MMVTLAAVKTKSIRIIFIIGLEILEHGRIICQAGFHCKQLLRQDHYCSDITLVKASGVRLRELVNCNRYLIVVIKIIVTNTTYATFGPGDQTLMTKYCTNSSSQ
jgi:hypothetical protein|tara:strand:+ start:1239 stop:1553 length:315 start_codon:yes stop_codon:yes gene_type:complete